jgi:hypothetical protein
MIECSAKEVVQQETPPQAVHERGLCLLGLLLSLPRLLIEWFPFATVKSETLSGQVQESDHSEVPVSHVLKTLEQPTRLSDFAGNQRVLIERVNGAQPVISIRNDDFSIG